MDRRCHPQEQPKKNLCRCLPRLRRPVTTQAQVAFACHALACGLAQNTDAPLPVCVCGNGCAHLIQEGRRDSYKESSRQMGDRLSPLGMSVAPDGQTSGAGPRSQGPGSTHMHIHGAHRRHSDTVLPTTHAILSTSSRHSRLSISLCVHTHTHIQTNTHARLVRTKVSVLVSYKLRPFFPRIPVHPSENQPRPVLDVTDAQTAAQNRNSLRWRWLLPSRGQFHCK